MADINVRYDGGLSIDLGRMSYLDDVIRWGEALVGISPDWRIEGTPELNIHSGLSSEQIGRYLRRAFDLTVQEITFGPGAGPLHIALSGGVVIDCLRNDAAPKVDKVWLIVPPTGGMIYLKSGKVRFDPSYRTMSSLMDLPPGAYA